MDAAYRWFSGYGLSDPLPDVSVIWQNRRRRFRNTDIPQQTFDEIVRQAMDAGLVGGKVLYTDSTHLKTNANKNKFEAVKVAEMPKAYMKELDKAVAGDRKKHGKKPLKKKDDDEPKGGSTPGKEKEIKQSKTDPESGFMHREENRRAFFITFFITAENGLTENGRRDIVKWK